MSPQYNWDQAPSRTDQQLEDELGQINTDLEDARNFLEPHKQAAKRGQANSMILSEFQKEVEKHETKQAALVAQIADKKEFEESRTKLAGLQQKQPPGTSNPGKRSSSGRNSRSNTQAPIAPRQQLPPPSQ